MKGIRKYAVLSAACISFVASSLAPVAAQSYRLTRDEFRSQVAPAPVQTAQPGLGTVLLNTMVNKLVDKVVGGQPLMPRIPSMSPVYNPPYSPSYASSTSSYNSTASAFPSPSALSPPSAFSSPSRTPTNVANVLNSRELSVLGTRDVVILVDKSGSMDEQDCPGGTFGAGLISRWEWVQRQVLSLTQQTAKVMRNGMTLVLFDSKAAVFRNVSPAQVPMIFSSARPKGGTYLAKALKDQLNEYFDRRASTASGVRPLAIAVITDGVPDSESSVRAVINDATRKMNRPGEITITFLQVGNDAKGAQYMSRWDDALTADGAAYDIVDAKPFVEMSRMGLGRSVVAAINKVGG